MTEQEQDMLAKTNRINLLFDFYRPLLTEKQQVFMQLYFHEDFSLGEIAESYEISRQAVNEHIKRAEQMLEEYESRLQLLKQHNERKHLLLECKDILRDWKDEVRRGRLIAKLNQLGGDSDGV